jgi:acyl-CoA dehydrogenase
VIPSDKLGHDVAKLLLEPSATRDRLTAGMHLPTTGEDPVSLIERALAATLEAEPIEARLRAAAKEGRFDAKLPPAAGVEELLERARAASVVTAAEAATVAQAHDLVAKVIRVDDFPQDLGASEMQLDPLAGAPRTTTATTPPVSPQKAAA